MQGGQNGEYLHRSASLFSGFSSLNKPNYVSVAVKFISVDKSETTVKVTAKAGQQTSYQSNVPDP